MEGRGLWPVIFGDQQWPERVLFGLSAFSDCYYMVHANGWHYIRHRGNSSEELYDWRTDPAETWNLPRRDRYATWHARVLMNWFLDVHGKGGSYTNPYHWKE